MPELKLVVTDRRPKGERLRCERCSTERQAQTDQTIEDLRADLRLAGWVCSSATDADVCPQCRAKAV